MCLSVTFTTSTARFCSCYGTFMFALLGGLLATWLFCCRACDCVHNCISLNHGTTRIPAPEFGLGTKIILIWFCQIFMPKDYACGPNRSRRYFCTSLLICCQRPIQAVAARPGGTKEGALGAGSLPRGTLQRPKITKFARQYIMAAQVLKSGIQMFACA